MPPKACNGICNHLLQHQAQHQAHPEALHAHLHHMLPFIAAVSNTKAPLLTVRYSPLEPDSPVPVSHPICCGELLVWLPLLLLVLHPICCRLLLLLVLHPKHWGQGLLHPGHHLVWHPSGWLLLEWLLLHPNPTQAWHVYCTKTTIVAQMYNTPCIVSHALPRHQCKE